MGLQVVGDPADSATGDPVSEESAGQLTSPDRRATILVAEDNESNLDMLSDYLESKNYAVIVARNGRQAVDGARAGHPDIIVMDVQMPGMDGLEATRRIRTEPELASVPIIAMTGLTMPDEVARCLEAGADDCLCKPVGLKLLVKTIESWLRPHG